MFRPRPRTSEFTETCSSSRLGSCILHLLKLLSAHLDSLYILFIMAVTTANTSLRMNQLLKADKPVFGTFQTMKGVRTSQLICSAGFDVSRELSGVWNSTDA